MKFLLLLALLVFTVGCQRTVTSNPHNIKSGVIVKKYVMESRNVFGSTQWRCVYFDIEGEDGHVATIRVDIETYNSHKKGDTFSWD